MSRGYNVVQQTLTTASFTLKVTPCVNAEEDEEENGEPPQRGAAVAEERQGDAYHGGKPEDHADVYEDMEEENAQDAIAIDLAELERLALGDMDKTKDEGKEEKEHASRAEEAFLLTYGAEDKVGILLWDVFQLRLCSVKKPFPCQASRTNCYDALVDVIPRSCKVFLQSEEDIDTLTLMRAEKSV